MEPLPPNIKENIHISKKTFEAVQQFAQILHVNLTPSQLAVCIGLIERGVSFEALAEAISCFAKLPVESNPPKTSHV